MRINSLHIYGFGKFKDYKIALTNGTNIIEGLNEAGKTTIMSFIRAILFGFESRRNLEQRYEPFDGGRFGGLIELTDNNGEVVQIERVFKQKIAGDVKIYLVNGETRGEEYLTYLLGNINSQVYKQIYSFGLGELQQIKSLEDDEVNNFIYHAGTGTVNQILKLKEDLESKQQELYNTGHKPEINRLLTKLEETKKKIDNLKEKNDQYDNMFMEIKDLEQELKDIDNGINLKSERLNRLTKLKQNAPIYTKIKELEQALDKFPTQFFFPENGVERLDNILENIEGIEVDINHYKNKIDEKENKITNLNLDKTVIEVEQIISSIKDDLHRYKEGISKKASISNELVNVDSKIESNFTQIGSNFNEEKIKTIEITLQDKQYLQELSLQIDVKSDELSKMVNQLELKNDNLNKVKYNLEKISNSNIKENESNILRDIYPTIKNNYSKIKEQQNQIIQLEQQKNFYNTQNKKQKRIINSVPYIFNGVVASLGIAFTFADKWQYGIPIFLFSLANLTYSYLKQKNNKKASKKVKEDIRNIDNQIYIISQKINKLNEQSLDLLKQIGVYQINEETLTELDRLYIKHRDEHYKHNEIKNKKAEYLNEIELIKLDINKLEQSKEEIKNNLSILKKEWEAWLTNHYLSKSLSSMILFDVISIIQQTKEIIKQKEFLIKEVNDIKLFLSSYEERLNELCQQLNYKLKESIEETVYSLTNSLKVNKEIKIELDRLTELMDKDKELLAKEKEKLQTQQKKSNDLLTYAKAENKEEYYKLAKEYEQYKSLINEKTELEARLKGTINSENEYYQLIDSLANLNQIKLENELAEVTKYIAEDNNRIKSLSEQKGNLQSQLKQMEEDKTLAELYQEYAILQTELKSKAKEWITAGITKRILEQTMKIYETEKQPDVIKRTGKYFSIITNGKYLKIIKPLDSKTIEVIKEDGIRTEPQFLSRGTVEQLFLAMRFAIIDSFSDIIKLPILLDDIYVNFDYKRLTNSLDVLDEVAKNQQIIMFTCHKHISIKAMERLEQYNHVLLS